MKTTVNGREYTVEKIHTATGADKEDMQRRGWDGDSYLLTGKRGAVKLAYRSAKTGEFSIVV